MDEFEKQDLIQNMKDAACSEDKISEVLHLLDSNQTEAGILKLKHHRCELMNELHNQQQKVDCLDYLLRQIQGGK